MINNRLFFLTRRIGFLWKSALVLGVSIIAIGSIASLFNVQPRSAADRLFREIVDPDMYGLVDEKQRNVIMADAVNTALLDCLAGERSFYTKLKELHVIITMASAQYDVRLPESGELVDLTPNEYAIVSAFGRMCIMVTRSPFLTADRLRATEEGLKLVDMAARPEQYALFALALALEGLDHDYAEQALMQEAALFNDDAPRKQLVRMCLEHRSIDRLETLANDPPYRHLIDPYVLQRIALSKMDWLQLVKTLIPAAYTHVNPAMVILALVSGLVWATVLLRFSGAPSLCALPVKLALPALLLGALSAHATILFIFWQEHQLGLGLGKNMLSQFAYCMGIGLREEGLKLLLFCPLIPFLRKSTDLETLTVAGLVGLGFAIEENINYFQGSAGLSALGRFATANFLHISLTALGGLMLTRACLHRGAHIREAAVTFAAIVVFHGLYDAFLIVEQLADYAWLSFTVFIMLSYKYFEWLRYLRDEWKDSVSVTCVFTLGLTAVTGLSYCLFAWQAGVTAAFFAVSSEIMAIAVILIMFYREIPETIQH